MAQPNTHMRMTPEQEARRKALLDAAELIKSATRDDIQTLVDDQDGYDDRRLLIESLHEALEHAVNRLNDDSAQEHAHYIEQGEYHEQRYAETKEPLERQTAEDYYELAVICDAQQYSVESYVGHHEVITDDEAVEMAHQAIHEVGGVDTKAAYENASRLLTERMLAK